MSAATSPGHMLASTLTAMRASQEGGRVLRTTASMLKCFLFFDIIWLISGIVLITMALTNQTEGNRDQIVIFGGMFGVFASVSALVNSLASHGVRTWRRNFLLPWLAFYLVILGIMIMHVAQSLYFSNLMWRQLFLVLATLTLFSCWKHMHKQYHFMAMPRPSQQIIVDVESMVRDYLRPATAHSDPADLPPKYEDCEELPPQYSEATMETENLTQQDTLTPPAPAVPMPK